MDAIVALTTRASPAALVDPAPDQDALDRMLRAAMRAPDHGRLRPWRFIVIDGPARARFGDVLAESLRVRDPQAAGVAIEKERAKPMRAPMIVVAAATLQERRGVPAVEQVVAVGAAAQNMLVAAHALGFGGFWRTGAPAYDDAVKHALGLRADDAIVGFLYIGTPSGAPATVAVPEIASHVTRWSGDLSTAPTAEGHPPPL